MICKSNMRQTAIALISYAADNNGLYPDSLWGRWQVTDIARQETEGHGTQGAGDFDHRDILRSYAGTQLNDILKCPLADPWWFEDADGSGKRQDIDGCKMGALPHVATPYMFFYGSLPSGNNTSDIWPRDQAMVGRPGDGNLDHDNRATKYLPGEIASANHARTDGSVSAY